MNNSEKKLHILRVVVEVLQQHSYFTLIESYHGPCIIRMLVIDR